MYKIPSNPNHSMILCLLCHSSRATRQEDLLNVQSEISFSRRIPPSTLLFLFFFGIKKNGNPGGASNMLEAEASGRS